MKTIPATVGCDMIGAGGGESVTARAGAVVIHARRLGTVGRGFSDLMVATPGRGSDRTMRSQRPTSR